MELISKYLRHEVLFYAKAEVVKTDQFKALISLFEKDKEYQITMHRQALEANDLFQIGRWFDFRVVRVDGLVDLELSRRPDLERNKWTQKVNHQQEDVDRILTSSSTSTKSH